MLEVLPGSRLDQALDHEASELLRLMKRKRSNYGSDRPAARGGDRRDSLSYRDRSSDRFDRFDKKNSFDKKGSYRSRSFDDGYTPRGAGGRRDSFDDSYSGKRGGYGGNSSRKPFGGYQKPSKRYEEEFGRSESPKAKQGAWGRVADVLDGIQGDKPSQKPSSNPLKRFL